MNLNEILSRLQNVKKSGGGFTARCPNHNDRQNSLSVSEKDGKVLLHCHALCSANSICAGIGIELKDLFITSSDNGQKAATGQANAKKRQIIAAYDYTDENGNLLFQAVRTEPKGFFQRRIENGKEITNLTGVRLIPYNLPEIIKNLNRAVFICEGEKDVETLRAKGLVATCNPMGAGKWRDEYSEFFKDRIVYVVPDNDDAGRKHAEAVARSLDGKAKEIRIVHLPDLPEKGDVSDFLENHSVEDLKEIVKDAPIYTPPIETEPAEKISKLSPLHTIKLSDVKAAEIVWLWKPFIAIGAFIIIEGAEGEGKTFITLAIATTTGIGKGFPMMSDDEHLEPANVVLMSAEDSLAHTIKPRLDAMNAPCESIIAIDEPFTLDRDGIIRLGMVLAEYAPKLVIIDPLFSYTGKVNLDRDNEIRSVTSELIRLAEKYQCAIVGVRHIGKSKGMGDPRNAGLNGIGWRASARSVLLVGKNPENEKQKAIVQTKNNLAPICDKAIGYEIREGEFFWTGESKLTAEKMLSIARNEDERAENSEAVTFLREALRESEREAKDVEKEVDKFGITAKQLRTARNKLDVQWRREGFGKDSKVFWRLPSIDAQNAPETIIDAYEKEKGHLCVNDSDKTSSDNNLRIDALSANKGHLWSEKQPARASMELAEKPAKTKCWSCGELFQDSEICPKCGKHQEDLPF